MTHNNIVEIGCEWLKKHKENIIIPNCSIVTKDFKTPTISGEIPDIIGWCSWASVLIEVKTSRNDFSKDSKKPFREYSYIGAGEFKYYLTPKGLITENELPELWGLLWIDQNGEISIEKKSEKHESNLKTERTILISIINNK